MPKRVDWTREQLAALLRGVARGDSYDIIAEAVGLSRNAVINKTREYPRFMAMRERALAGPRRETNDRENSALPGGHPKSWELLTRGTCLEGAPFTGRRWGWGDAPVGPDARGV